MTHKRAGTAPDGPRIAQDEAGALVPAEASPAALYGAPARFCARPADVARCALGIGAASGRRGSASRSERVSKMLLRSRLERLERQAMTPTWQDRENRQIEAMSDEDVLSQLSETVSVLAYCIEYHWQRGEPALGENDEYRHGFAEAVHCLEEQPNVDVLTAQAGRRAVEIQSNRLDTPLTPCVRCGRLARFALDLAGGHLDCCPWCGKRQEADHE